MDDDIAWLTNAPLTSAELTRAQRETLKFLEIVLGVTIVDEAVPGSPLDRLLRAKTREEARAIIKDAHANPWIDPRDVE